jgi:hypothetical protein
MPTFLFHPPRGQKILIPLLGKEALRSFESLLEGERVSNEKNLTCQHQLKPSLPLLPFQRKQTFQKSPDLIYSLYYGTFPVLAGTVDEFPESMKEVPQTKVLALKPGETIQ